jgi:hypothetical protein
MSQIVKRGSDLVLQPCSNYDVAEYMYSGEVIGGTGTELFVDGRSDYVLALNPGTVGLIEVTTVCSETNSTTGGPISSWYGKLIIRYTVSRTGVITISRGADTYSDLVTPSTPAILPTNRLLTNVSVNGVSRSGTNYYPHCTIVVSAPSAQTSNWLISVKVHTLPFKGA